MSPGEIAVEDIGVTLMSTVQGRLLDVVVVVAELEAAGRSFCTCAFCLELMPIQVCIEWIRVL